MAGCHTVPLSLSLSPSPTSSSHLANSHWQLGLLFSSAAYECHLLRCNHSGWHPSRDEFHAASDATSASACPDPRVSLLPLQVPSLGRLLAEEDAAFTRYGIFKSHPLGAVCAGVQAMLQLRSGDEAGALGSARQCLREALKHPITRFCSSTTIAVGQLAPLLLKNWSGQNPESDTGTGAVSFGGAGTGAGAVASCGTSVLKSSAAAAATLPLPSTSSPSTSASLGSSSSCSSSSSSSCSSAASGDGGSTANTGGRTASDGEAKCSTDLGTSLSGGFLSVLASGAGLTESQLAHLPDAHLAQVALQFFCGPPESRRHPLMQSAAKCAAPDTARDSQVGLDASDASGAAALGLVSPTRLPAPLPPGLHLPVSSQWSSASAPAPALALAPASSATASLGAGPGLPAVTAQHRSAAAPESAAAAAAHAPGGAVSSGPTRYRYAHAPSGGGFARSGDSEWAALTQSGSGSATSGTSGMPPEAGAAAAGEARLHSLAHPWSTSGNGNGDFISRTLGMMAFAPSGAGTGSVLSDDGSIGIGTGTGVARRVGIGQLMPRSASAAAAAARLGAPNRFLHHDSGPGRVVLPTPPDATGCGTAATLATAPSSASLALPLPLPAPESLGSAGTGSQIGHGSLSVASALPNPQAASAPLSFSAADRDRGGLSSSSSHRLGMGISMGMGMDMAMDAPGTRFSGSGPNDFAGVSQPLAGSLGSFNQMSVDPRFGPQAQAVSSTGVPVGPASLFLSASVGPPSAPGSIQGFAAPASPHNANTSSGALSSHGSVLGFG